MEHKSLLVVEGPPEVGRLPWILVSLQHRRHTEESDKITDTVSTHKKTLDGLISFIGIHVIQKFQKMLYNCTCTFCEATWTTVFTFWETQLLVLHRLP